MSTIAPRFVVDAPLFARWRPGLEGASRAAGRFQLTPVVPFDDGTDFAEVRAINDAARWAAGGIAYRPELAWLRPDGESTQTGPGSYIACPVDANGVDETGQDAKAVRRGEEVVEWDPFYLYDGDGCTTLDSDVDTAIARATRSLELQTSHLVEQVLWTGTVNGLDFTANHPNVALASAAAATPAGTTAMGVVTAMREMVEALSETLGGAQGMIHVPAWTLPFLSFYGQIERINNAIYTYGADHIIAAGTGYPGTNPDGDLEADVTWIYGTSLVDVRYTNIVPVGDTMRAYSFVERSTNDIEALVERAALASFDLSAHIGIPVCLPDPGPDCPTSS